MNAPAPRPTPEHPGPMARQRRPLLLLALVLAVLAVGGVAWAVSRGGDEPDETGAGGGAPGTGGTVSVLDVGAVGDGTTDDTAALQAAFDAAEPGDTVLLPEGRTFAHGDVLSLSSPDVTVTGGGTLLATDEERSSLVLAADGVVLDDVTLDVEETTRRWDAYEQQRLRLDGHSGITVRDVRVEGSAAAGVYVGGATADFLLDHLQVSGTRADGIHITQGAHDGEVVSPQVRDVGDDGVAVVSYRQDGDPCARIRVVSPVVDGSSGGRGISVVGGEDVTWSDVDVRDTYAAGIYLAAEGSFDTVGVRGVEVDGGSVTDANTGVDIDHGAVLVYNGTDEQSVSEVTVQDVTVTDTRADASRWVGLIADGEGPITDVSLLDLALDGDGPKTLLSSNDDETGYRAEGWTRDGEPIDEEDLQAEAAGATTGLPGSGPGAQGGAGGGAGPTAAAQPAGAAAAGELDPPSVSVLAFGAVGDGRTDDTRALQAAFDAAPPGTGVLLPAGHVFVQSDVLTVRSPGITVFGGGTVLATDERRSSLTLAADDVLFRDVTLRVSSTTKRWDAYEQQRLRIDGHTGITVRRVVVDGSAAAGIYVGGGAGAFRLEDVRVSGTRADGIHMTQGVHDGTVVAPTVTDVGDDGVAVVSYRRDGVPCARIVVRSPTVAGSSGGRGVSVVGGTDVTYTDIDVRDTYAAGVYVAAEGGWDSAGVDRVVVRGGSVAGANQGTDIDHGAVLVYNGTTDRTVQGVQISGLTLSGTRSSVSRWVGLVADGTGQISDAALDGMAINGTGPGAEFVSNAASTTFRLEHWTRDGRVLPAQRVTR